MIGGTGNLRAPGLCLPMEIRADISTSLAAAPADELLLDVGQPDVIGPAVGADGRAMAATIVRAIDQDPANA